VADAIEGHYAIKISFFIDRTLRLEDFLPFGLIRMGRNKLNGLIPIEAGIEL
jgi:hypothetical protein